MKIVKLILPMLFVSFVVLVSIAGIYRHDVHVQEYVNLANEKQFDCTGQVYKDTSALGSCVLINENHILTAAHLFVEFDEIPDTMIYNGKQIVTYQTTNRRVVNTDRVRIKLNDKLYTIEEIILHPKYLKKSNQGYHDLAIVKLKDPIVNIQPALVNTAFDELNSNVVGVGYGASGIANKPDLVGQYNLKIAGQNVIDKLSGVKVKNEYTVLESDFDHPSNPECNKMGSATPRPLEYCTSGGDSGGPLFRKVENNWQLIGICSGGGIDMDQFLKTQYYGQTSAWTRVSPYQKWLEKHVN